VLELQDKIKDNNTSTITTTSTTTKQSSMHDQLEHKDDVSRNQRTALTESAGGGFGYDQDAAAPIVQWGVADNTYTSTSTSKTYNDKAKLGEKEAKAYLDAFCALQMWVLMLLPDDHPDGSNLQPKTHSVIAKAQELIAGSDTISLSFLVSEISKLTTNNDNSHDHAHNAAPLFQVPPPAKPELFLVTFALLVHTYCKLLEVGMGNDGPRLTGRLSTHLSTHLSRTAQRFVSLHDHRRHGQTQFSRLGIPQRHFGASLAMPGQRARNIPGTQHQ
jgi:hypothetical protein